MASKEPVTHVDDSIHAMIAKDKKKRDKAGQNAEVHYKPRQEHPLFQDQTGGTEPAEKENPEETRENISELLYNAEHHNDTVDPRDRKLARER